MWAIGLTVGRAGLFYKGSFLDGLAFAEFLAMFSGPSIVIAAVFCGRFPFSVRRHPKLRALGAVA